MTVRNLLVLLLTLISTQFFGQSLFAQTPKHIWAQIPFNIQGANLCEFRSAYSRDRLEYMRELRDLSFTIFTTHSRDSRSNLLQQYNDLYERNLSYAQIGLGAGLEASFKSFLESYYTNLSPTNRNLFFTYAQDKVNASILGQYSLSPNCNGSVIVTLELITKNKTAYSFQATGPVQTVMSKIASQLFTKYQKTAFPSFIMHRGKELELIGGINGRISKTRHLSTAQEACSAMGARLPDPAEYKTINLYGSWAGGISLADKPWAMNYPNVFVKYNGKYQVRNIQFLGQDVIYYTCVR